MLPETPRRSRSSQSTPFPHASPSSPVSNESDDSDLSSSFNNRKMHQSSTASFIQNRDHLGRGLTVCVDVVFIKLLIWYVYSIKVMARNVNENPLLGTYA